MKIALKEIPIRDVVLGYKNDEIEGVTGYGGKLNIRPKYQREFIYKDAQRDAVIETIRKNFPLNVMYWAENSDGTFEVMDGQQRTISFCEYIVGKFSINYQYFHNLEKEEKEQILDYKLMVYICEGTDKEKLDWFKIINIAGMKLSDQELRNAIYTGEWLTDAKKYFSKPSCYALQKSVSKYLKGDAIRQDYLETALDWISNGRIEDYMAMHQNKPHANELFLYFKRVIDWVEVIFPVYRKEMKGVAFGRLYNLFKETEINPQVLEEEISVLLKDEDVTSKPGIYSYVLTREEKHLSIRAFSDAQISESYERQKGICVKCQEHFEQHEMEADHIMPWSEGGRTVADNCQMLCKGCNRKKSYK